MKICEIFEGIQGEGPLVGTPMLFIRMSGCNLNCGYCDSKYHKTVNYDISVKELRERIKQSNKEYICWTGGEPTLQIRDIRNVIMYVGGKYHSLETNGTQREFNPSLFNSISVSPKDIDSASYWASKYSNVSVKVVTDLEKVNMGLIKYADYLMPLSTNISSTWDPFREAEDQRIKQRVWGYCTKHNIKYSPRLQVDLWGGQRCK